MSTSYRHLTRDERCQIYILRKRGDSISTIADQVNIHRSTIYRELKRNSGQRGYRHKQAEERALERRHIASSRAPKMTQPAKNLIEEKLRLQWSPVQISGWLERVFFENAVSHETIYKYIWKNKRHGGVLYKELRHNGKKYNKRSKGTAGRGSIPNRVDIAQRPPIVEEKSRFGDWEIDTIVGTGQSGAIVSMVERTSKYTMLVKVTEKTAQKVESALLSRLMPVKQFVLTVTADNGKEFSTHQNVSNALGTGFYFATPYHSWERGLNEHTNGLVRQYFPKSKRFDELSEEDIVSVEYLLNNRPRKILGFITPQEVFKSLAMASHN